MPALLRCLNQRLSRTFVTVLSGAGHPLTLILSHLLPIRALKIEVTMAPAALRMTRLLSTLPPETHRLLRTWERRSPHEDGQTQQCGPQTNLSFSVGSLAPTPIRCASATSSLAQFQECNGYAA